MSIYTQLLNNEKLMNLLVHNSHIMASLLNISKEVLGDLVDTCMYFMKILTAIGNFDTFFRLCYYIKIARSYLQ